MPRLRLSRRIAVLAALAAVLGGAAGVLLADPSQGHPFPLQPTTGSPELSVLDSPPTAEGLALGARFAGSDFAEKAGVVTTGIRLAATSANGKVFVAPTARGWVCVVLVHRALGDVPAASCAPRRTLGDELLGVQIPDGDRWVTAGLVPDGYTSVAVGSAIASVEGNGFQLITASDTGDVVVTGPGLPPLTP